MPNEVLARWRPEPHAALDASLAAARAVDAHGLLDLAAARIRMLLGVPTLGGPTATTDAKTAAVADYATSPLFTETERLALEFTEQFVMDVANTPDELVAALRDDVGPADLYAFVMGLYALDQAERLALTTTVHPGASR